MKKIIWSLVYVSLINLHVNARQILSDVDSPKFSSAFSSGYVFKNDCRFQKVYGRGMIDIITGAFVFYPWDFWGLGLKVSYWQAKGNSTLFNFNTKLREIPLMLTLQRLLIFKHGIELYFSAGGGAAWIKEKSYLDTIKFWKGLGEIEIGANWPLYKNLKLTTAFRYLFPRQFLCSEKIDVGGCDLRGGLEFSF